MDTHIYQMFSQDVRSSFVLRHKRTVTDKLWNVGGLEDERGAHLRRVCLRLVALVVRPLDDRRRVDARCDGLRQVPERPRRRRAVRWVLPGFDQGREL